MKPASLRSAIESYRQQRADIYRLAPAEAVSNARGAKAIARDHMSRVIYELLQNAEDAGASEVRVELHPASLTLFFADDGTGIAPQAIESLAGLFLSTKSAGIGRKGVGFKAVYSVSDHPVVFSGEDAIQFDRERAREWMAEQGLETRYVPYQWLPFYRTRADIEQGHELLRALHGYRTVVMLPLRDAKASESLCDDLKTFDARSLLAFRRIQRLDVRITGVTEYAITVTGERGTSGLCRLHDTRRDLPSRWQLEWNDFQAPAEALASLEEDERERARTSKVMVGVEADADDQPVEPSQTPNLLVYYPTRHLAPSRLLTHADLVVTSDRTQIAAPSGQPYNAWLVACLAEATVAFCNALIEHGHDRFVLRMLAHDARRKDPQEMALREAVLSTARRDLSLHVINGQRAVPARCHVIDSVDTEGFLEFASRTELSGSLPLADVLQDTTATSSLRDLGARVLSDLELLEVVSSLVGARPSADSWVLALWRWLRAVEESLPLEKAAQWEARLRELPFLPSQSEWVAPADLNTTPFLLGALRDRTDGICQIHECHSRTFEVLTAAADRQALTQFLKQYGVDEDAAHAQVKALDLATKDFWKNDQRSEKPERFIRAIHAWGLLSVPRPGSLLTDCPVPIRLNDTRAWAPAWKAYLAEGEGSRYVRTIYRGNPNVAWIERRRLIDLGVAPDVIEWLDCPTRPKIVVHKDETRLAAEGARVRGALGARGIYPTHLYPVQPPKHLQNLSVESLDQKQRSSLLAVLARGWDEYYKHHAHKQARYFYYSDRMEVVDEPWWVDLTRMPVETDGIDGDVPLTDCRLALTDEVRALRPFTAQPRLPGLGKGERDKVMEWLGSELRLAIQLNRLSWDDWDRLLGDAVPKFWTRHANEPLAATRVRDAYRLFLKWRGLPGRAQTGALKRRAVLCEGPSGPEIVDARRQTVYVDDDAELRTACGRRVYIVEFQERVREAAVSAFGLSRLSRAAHGPRLIALEGDAGELALTLMRRLEESRPFVLALMRHKHDEGEVDQLTRTVQKLELRVVRRIEFSADLVGPEGSFKVEFTRPFVTERHVCYVAVEGLTGEADVLWNAARAIARAVDLRELHWAIRELLQTDELERRSALLRQQGVSATELEDCEAALAPQPREPEHTTTSQPDAPEGEEAPPSSKATAHGRPPAKATPPVGPRPGSQSGSAGTRGIDPSLKEGRTAPYTLDVHPSDNSRQARSVGTDAGGASRTAARMPLSDVVRARIDTESRQICLRELARLGYAGREMDVMHPGYDIEATKNGRMLLIEVKGHLVESKFITLSRTQWETFRRCRQSSDHCRWELWNVENLAEGAGEVIVTRYRDIPLEALTPGEFSVDLSTCGCVGMDSSD